MINKIFYGLTITFFLFLLIVVPVTAAPMETTYGVVLNEQGDGMELREDKITPIDPYYNYISYRGIDAKPGQIIITVATLDEYGDWEDRRDFPTTESVDLEKYLEIKKLNDELTNLVYSK